MSFPCHRQLLVPSSYDYNWYKSSWADQLNAESASFTYDALNRLARSTVGSDTLAYTYDNWGNRLAVQVTAGSGTQTNTQSSPQNQLLSSGFSYDAAGNVINDYLHTYTWDAEEKLASVANGGVSYAYDPEGERIAKITTGGSVQEEYLYGMDGHLATTVDASGNLIDAILYGAGQHIADYRGTMSTGDTLFRFENQVGSLLSTWNQTGALQSMCIEAPFGEDLTCTPSIDYEQTQYTDKRRDAESGNDYFGARYYASRLARFMSPDPSGLLAQKPQDPQSWNLYVYARNNPFINLDPTGLDCVYANDAGNGVESIDHDSNAGECGQNGGTWAPGYVDGN